MNNIMHEAPHVHFILVHQVCIIHQYWFNYITNIGLSLFTNIIKHCLVHTESP